MDTILGLPIQVVIVAVLASGVRVSLAEESVNTREVLSTLGAALFIAITGYPALTEVEYSPGVQTLIISSTAFFSRDLLLVLLRLKEQIAKDPLGILRDYLNWRRDKND